MNVRCLTLGAFQVNAYLLEDPATGQCAVVDTGDGPQLANALAASMERDMRGANSWRLGLTEDDNLVWTSDAGVRHLQPARGFMQRVENLFFKLLPASYY